MCDELVLGRPYRIPEAKGHRLPDQYYGGIYLVFRLGELGRARQSCWSGCHRQTFPCACVCNLVFIIPLHAARRTMAVAVGFLHHHILSQTEMTGPSRAPLSSFTLVARLNKGKERVKEGTDKGKRTSSPLVPS